MITTLRVSITTDDGLPVIIYGREESTTQAEGEFDKNMARTAEAAISMLMDAGDAIRRQLSEMHELYGGDPGTGGPPPEPPPPRPRPPRRRGR